MKNYFALFAVAGAVAACSSTPTSDQSLSQAQPVAPRASSADKPATQSTTAPASSSSTAGANLGAANPAAARSVYFEYDSSAVTAAYRPVISAHAQNLSQNRARQVTIQGNTDERGSREYNLALGQQRADSVKQGLTLLGVPASQIETISFGEEKPQSEGESESAFTENRRADIVYR